MSGSEPRKWLARLPAPRTVLRALGVVALVMVELLLALDWQHVERPLAASVALIPLIIVAGFVTLSQRDRHPVGVFAIVMILSASAAVVPLYHPIIVPLAALYAVATRRPARTALLALLTTILMFAVIAVCYPVPDLPPGTRWVSAVGYALIAVITWAAGRLFGSQARKLTDMTTQRAAAIEAAVAAERLRLARELHDIVSHSVSIMVVQAGGARRMISRDPQRAEQAMYAVEDLGREAMDELRRLLTVLRSASGESAPDAQDAPGLDALPSLISKTTDAGIPTMLEIEGEEGSLAPSVGLTAYRVVQEALTNAVKHAGQGATARVRLHWTTIGDDAAPGLSVRISDEHPPDRDEAAASPTELSIGLGLAGLAERVTAVGGTFSAHSTETGFLVTAMLPATRTGRIEINLTEPSPALGAGSRLGTDGQA